MYKQLDCKLPGNVAIKVHSGEFGNKNFLRRSSGVPSLRKSAAPS